jgi:hypothetical protein
MRKVWALAAGLAAASLATGASASLLTNGDFETPSAPYSLPPGWDHSQAVTGGPMNAPNLFVTDGAAYTACCGTTGSPAASANRFATFGAGDSPNAGAYLGQSFATVAGKSYLVSFDLAAFGVPGTQSVHLRLDDLSNLSHIAHQDYLATSSPVLDGAFTTFTLGFVATGAQTVLTFQNGSAITDDIDAIIDNVNVTAAVPEPVTWALMIAGFGLAGATLRRRVRAC